MGNNDLKLSNPKDAIGVTKLPLSLVPPTAIAVACLAHLDGALKYGKWNWRKAGVRASVYLDALRRHISKWEDGDEEDPDGVLHLGHALACINILVDAQACGKLIDDRPPRANIEKFFADLTPWVGKLKAKHADRAPYHYSIKDNDLTEPVPVEVPKTATNDDKGIVTCPICQERGDFGDDCIGCHFCNGDGDVLVKNCAGNCGDRNIPVCKNSYCQECCSLLCREIR